MFKDYLFSTDTTMVETLHPIPASVCGTTAVSSCGSTEVRVYHQYNMTECNFIYTAMSCLLSTVGASFISKNISSV